MSRQTTYKVEVYHVEYDVEFFETLKEATDFIAELREDTENLPMCDINIVLSVEEVLSHQTI